MREVNVAGDIQSVVEAAALLGLALGKCSNGDDPALLESELQKVDEALRRVTVTRAMHPDARLEMTGGEPIVGTDLEVLRALEAATSLPAPHLLNIQMEWDENEIAGTESELSHVALWSIKQELGRQSLKATSLTDGIYTVDITTVLNNIIFDLEH